MKLLTAFPGVGISSAPPVSVEVTPIKAGESSLKMSSMSLICKFLNKSSFRSSWSKSSGSTQLSAPRRSRRSKHSVYLATFLAASYGSLISRRSVHMRCCSFHLVKFRAILGILLTIGTTDGFGFLTFFCTIAYFLTYVAFLASFDCMSRTPSGV